MYPTSVSSNSSVLCASLNNSGTFFFIKYLPSYLSERPYKEGNVIQAGISSALYFLVFLGSLFQIIRLKLSLGQPETTGSTNPKTTNSRQNSTKNIGSNSRQNSTKNVHEVRKESKLFMVPDKQARWKTKLFSLLVITVFSLGTMFCFFFKVNSFFLARGIYFALPSNIQYTYAVALLFFFEIPTMLFWIQYTTIIYMWYALIFLEKNRTLRICYFFIYV